MTTLTKYWAILLKARRVGSQPEGYEDCSVVYLASDVDVLVEKFETALRESKAREVPLPSKHYTDEIIALKADLARVTAELGRCKARLVEVIKRARLDGAAVLQEQQAKHALEGRT